VTFACDGTITLAGTISNGVPTVLDGSSHQITISGSNARTVFWVAANVNFTLTNLTIAEGSSFSGGGIFNNGGIVTLVKWRFAGNCARGTNGGDGTPGQAACGGAIYNAGWLTAINCAFTSNSAVGGSSGQESWSSFPPCSSGGVGGDAGGGAICNLGNLVLTACLLANNSATGGVGGLGESGPLLPGSGFLNAFGGGGGAGGSAKGGALYNSGIAVLINDTVAMNGGTGGQGGSGGGGGGGGSAYGAICDINGQCYLTNCTVALNAAVPGTGGSGGAAGPPYPGFPYPNPAPPGWPPDPLPGPNGSNGGPGSGLLSTGTLFFNTLLAGNNSNNITGTITDAGHNLSSDASCVFTNSGMTNTNPKLGSLVNNGGPTLTMALLPGSPAIDAGSAIDAPTTDQRGIARPQGPDVDIGAFEYQYIPIFTSMTIQEATNCCLQLAGLLPNQTFTLQVSSNLLNWFAVTNFTGTNGFIQYADPTTCQSGKRFYRLKSGTP
jgi:hypothetical protein